MKTPRTDKLIEHLSVEPWLSTEVKCKSLHDFAEKLEVALNAATDLLDDVGEGTVDEKLERWHYAKISLDNPTGQEPPSENGGDYERTK